MLVRKKTYIFIDVEAALIRGKQQIIEIGAVKLFPNGTIETFSQLVQPYKFKKLSSFIHELTGITTEELQEAASFKEVIAMFEKWCGRDSIFITFGDFDRKVMEDECARYRINSEFLYPMIDFQQKYMIEYQLKNHPSLLGLLTELEITVNTQHRALADAISLLKIFEVLNGEELIEKQKTNKFILLLSEFRQRDNDFELCITYLNGTVEPSNLSIQSTKTMYKCLPFEVREENKVAENGEEQIIQKIVIESDPEVEKFIKEYVSQLNEKVLITRSGMRQLSRIHRLHHCAIPKIEAMTLQKLLNSEEAVSLFTLNGQSVNRYESKIRKLLQEYKHDIVVEFEKRNLFIKEEVGV